MSVNDHVNAINATIDDMSKEELANLVASLTQLLSSVKNRLHQKIHSQKHHSAPAESNKT